MDSWLLPVVLAIIMAGLGTTLHADDFRRFVRTPKPLLVGFCSQAILLPLLGFLTINLFSLPPEYAAGVLIISFCPGGIGSNLVVLLARADVALAISLTTITNILMVFWLPLLVNFSLVYLYGAGQTILLPIGETIVSTALVTILPVSIGMLIAARAPAVAAVIRKWIKPVSTLMLFVLMIGIFIKNRDVFLNTVFVLGGVMIFLNLASMLTGYCSGKLARLSHRECVTIAIETGFHNVALALLITTQFLHSDQMALPAAFYGGFMFVGAFLFVGLINAWVKQKA